MKLTYIKLSITRILFILLLALSNNVFAQNKEIKVTGTIYDETGITLPSVTVTVKGQKGVGVLSDMTENLCHDTGKVARSSFHSWE